MTPEIWQSIIALLGVIYAASVAAIFRNRPAPTRQKEKPKSREDFSEELKDTSASIREWISVEREVRALLEKTTVDRFLILVAINGDRDSTHATVIWERRQEPWKATFHYEDVALDRDYNEKLDYCSRNLYLKFRTEDAKNTRIGEYYEAEKVTEAVWSAVAKKSNGHTDQVGYLYFSAATHAEEGIDEGALRRIFNIKAEILRSIRGEGFAPV